MDASEAAIAMWRLEPGVLAGLALAAFFYLRGWRIVRRALPSRFPAWRAACFLAGLTSLWLAVASPLDALAGFLLQAHMVQHLVLTMVAPPLILAGCPYVPLLRGLPRAWSRGIAAPLLASPLVAGAGSVLTHPAVAWSLFAASNLLWHLPPLYEAALRSDAWHAAEHLCFFGTGIVFWWFVVQPWPSRPRWPRWAAIPYLLLADLQNTALAAFLTFYDKVLYPAYSEAPRIWDATPLTDQGAAGLLMWIPGSIGFLVPAGLIAIRLLSPSRGVRPSELRDQDGRARARNPPAARRPPRPVRAPIRAGRILAARTVLRCTLLALAVVVVWDGLFGPDVSSMNLAGVLPWTFWRGFAVLALLLVGNVVCTGCPFMLVRDWLRRIAPPPSRNWPRALRNKWCALALLVIFFWAYEVFALWDRPAATAWIIIGYFGAASAVDLVFRGASFCKWVCPIGQYHYAVAAPAAFEVKVRDLSVCASCKTHDCLRGNSDARGCELHLFQPKKSGAFDCTGCMDCVAACPTANVGLGAVVPGADIAASRRRSSVGDYAARLDLAALVALLTAAALVNAAAMTGPVAAFLDGVAAASGIAHGVAASIFLLGGMGLGSVAILACGRRAAFAFLPLGATLWAAHFVFHLLTGFWTFVPVAHRFLLDAGLAGGEPDWSLVGFSGDWILAIELALLDVGWLAALFILWKQAVAGHGRPLAAWLPRAAVATGYFVLAVWVVFQPMEMRGTALGLP